MDNADIVVKVHLAKPTNTTIRAIAAVATPLIRAVYPDVGEVGYVEGSRNQDGVNALQIRTEMDQATKHQLEEALTRIFHQKFEISINSELSLALNRQSQIEEVTKQFTHR